MSIRSFHSPSKKHKSMELQSLKALELTRTTFWAVICLSSLAIYSTRALADESSNGDKTAIVTNPSAQFLKLFDDNWETKISVTEKELEAIAAERFAGVKGFEEGWAKLPRELQYLTVTLPYNPKTAEELRAAYPGSLWEPIGPNRPKCYPNCPPPNFDMLFQIVASKPDTAMSEKTAQTIQALSSGEFETIYGLSWKWMQTLDTAKLFNADALPGVTKPDTLGYAYALTQDANNEIGYNPEAVVTLNETTKTALGTDFGSADFKAVFDLVQSYRINTDPTPLATLRLSQYDGLADTIMQMPTRLRDAALELPVDPTVQAPVYPKIPKCSPKCPKPIFITTTLSPSSETIQATLSALDSGEIKTLYGLSWNLMEQSDTAEEFRNSKLPGVTDPDTLGYLYALVQEVEVDQFDTSKLDLSFIQSQDLEGSSFEHVFSTIQNYRSEAKLAD
jgi:hypothetical protein